MEPFGLKPILILAWARTNAIVPLFTDEAESPLVLAVDDHPINRSLLARQLKLLGLRVRTAQNGKEALQIWRSGCFEILISLS